MGPALSQLQSAALSNWQDCIDPRRRAQAVVPRRNIRALFDAIDSDHSGDLDAHELLTALAGVVHNDELDEEAINELIRAVDENGDGVVQREEFENLVREPPKYASGIEPESTRLHAALSLLVRPLWQAGSVAASRAAL
jgi:hypothetical protein